MPTLRWLSRAGEPVAGRQRLGAELLLEAAECGRLELADPLAGEAELLADLLEARALLALDEAEAQFEHEPLPLRQVGERVAHPLLLEGEVCRLDRVLGGAVGEEV